MDIDCCVGRQGIRPRTRDRGGAQINRSHRRGARLGRRECDDTTAGTQVDDAASSRRPGRAHDIDKQVRVVLYGIHVRHGIRSGGYRVICDCHVGLSRTNFAVRDSVVH